MAAPRPARTAAALLLATAAWVFAARALWSSVVPASLVLPRVDPHAYFTGGALAGARSYGQFLSVDALLGEIALLVTLSVYAVRGERLMRESAAGPIGTGMLLGMLGLALVWLAQLPFGVAGLWWERRHHTSQQGYVTWVVGNFLGLAGKFLFVCAALLVVMAVARKIGRLWWIAAAPILVAIYLAFALLSPFLIPQLAAPSNPSVTTDANRIERGERVTEVPVSVQAVHTDTSAPNAESVGLGPTRRVILWDTLLDGRFTRREVDVVIAHEVGHLAHHDIIRDVGWFALLVFPLTWLLARVTRRRGGMGRPEAVPVALLVTVVLQFVVSPLENARSRRIEAAADWAALQTTRDPSAARALFERLATTSRDDPDPPAWSYVLQETHPTTMQRIAMVGAWQARR